MSEISLLLNLLSWEHSPIGAVHIIQPLYFPKGSYHFLPKSLFTILFSMESTAYDNLVFDKAIQVISCHTYHFYG